MDRPVKSWPIDRPKRDKSHRRWHVHYDLAYDGGGSGWAGYYRTRWGAEVASFWNRHFASWGGSAELFDTTEGAPHE